MRAVASATLIAPTVKNSILRRDVGALWEETAP
jgi:hypothetical protein